MNAKTGYGARAYVAVGVDSSVASANPHRLILMLYDGAIAAIHQAVAHLHSGDIAAKCAAVGKALRIVDEGLKASLDRKAGGALAFRLLDLYDYMVMRLLQANLRNDAQALDEVVRLLSELRTAWAQIEPRAAAPGGADPKPAPLPYGVEAHAAVQRLAVVA